MSNRADTILMLQGPPTRFWRELGAGFRANGRKVRHIGFTLADALWWRAPDGEVYRGRADAWPARLATVIAQSRVSDVLYYADRLPYHRAAIEVARSVGVRAWAIENGYLRPDWVTLEPEAMGAYSRLTRDPGRIMAAGAHLPVPDPAPVFRHGFPREAASEVAYNLAMAAGRPWARHFPSDKVYPPPLDYAGWLGKWLLGGDARGAVPEADALALSGRRFFLVALQLESDYQIRASSRYNSLREMLSQTIGSFAADAPPDAALIIKQHPMDNGLEAWPRVIRGLAAANGISDRVLVVDGGALDRYLASARGVVTVNSTVGILALRQSCPVIALGDAVYDVPGLTHQGGLRSFWNNPARPEPRLRDAFIALLAAQVQVRGSFYDPAGRRAAITEIVRRVGLPETYWRPERPLSALGPLASDRSGRPAGEAQLIAAE